MSNSRAKHSQGTFAQSLQHVPTAAHRAAHPIPASPAPGHADHATPRSLSQSPLVLPSNQVGFKLLVALILGILNGSISISIYVCVWWLLELSRQHHDIFNHSFQIVCRLLALLIESSQNHIAKVRPGVDIRECPPQSSSGRKTLAVLEDTLHDFPPGSSRALPWSMAVTAPKKMWEGFVTWNPGPLAAPGGF